MNEYSDTVYHKPESDVLHRVRIYWGLGKIKSACGRAIDIDFGDSNVLEEGEFSENFVYWLRENGRKVYALCCHCKDRDFNKEE